MFFPNLLGLKRFISKTANNILISAVDTDQIISAVYLKRITCTGFDDALFALWRAGEPDFTLDLDLDAIPQRAIGTISKELEERLLVLNQENKLVLHRVAVTPRARPRAGGDQTVEGMDHPGFIVHSHHQDAN